MREHRPPAPRLGPEHPSDGRHAGEVRLLPDGPGPRLPALPVEAAPGDARELLERLVARRGRASNMARTMAHAPAVLRGYQELARALKKGELRVELREKIALAIAAQTGCEYCLVAHTRAAADAGLSVPEIAAAMQGHANDPREDAVLRLALTAARDPHAVDDADVERLRALGFGDAAVTEVLAHVALNLFTNVFTIVARTEVDPAGAPQRGRAA